MISDNGHGHHLIDLDHAYIDSSTSGQDPFPPNATVPAPEFDPSLLQVGELYSTVNNFAGIKRLY